MRRGNEMLILVGNYMNALDGATTIDMPFAAVTSVKDLRGDQRYANAPKLELSIAPQEIVLLHVVGR